MMAQYPDVFIMTFSIHIPNFVLLSQTAQLLLIFCYAAPLLGTFSSIKSMHFNKHRQRPFNLPNAFSTTILALL